MISFDLTDELDNTAWRFAVVKAPNPAAATEAFFRALGYQGGGAEEMIWGEIPEYFETMVESADGAFYISGSDFRTMAEDEEPETEIIMITPAEPEERGYRTEQWALYSIDKHSYGGPIISIDEDGNIAVIEP